MMDKIVEIIPDDMPAWAKDAFDEGQFFRITLERIASLEAQLKEREWIKCEDKMPEIGIYQVFINPAMSHSFQAVATYFEGSFSVDGHDNSNAADLITHYSSLPSPPQEQDND